jgi:hypothetical protein
MNHDACISSNRRRAWSTRGQANGEEACVAGAIQGVKNKDQKELHAEAETRKALKARHARSVTCSKDAVDWEGTHKQGTRFH